VDPLSPTLSRRERGKCGDAFPFLEGDGAGKNMNYHKCQVMHSLSLRERVRERGAGRSVSHCR